MTNCLAFFCNADEIRIASMSSIMANGALIAGDFRAAEEFFKEARYGFCLVFLQFFEACSGVPLIFIFA